MEKLSNHKCPIIPPFLLFIVSLIAFPMLTVHAAGAGPYDIQLQQVDASQFPILTLFVSIKDPVSGAVVQGLTQEQFSVTEDKKAVEITGFSASNAGPISTVLTIDRSSSMSEEGKMAGAKEAANTFIDLMRPQDQVALVVFNNVVVEWQAFTLDKSILHTQVDAILPDGCTAWYDGVWQTVDVMQSVAGRRNAILLSDGIDCSEGDLLNQLFGGAGSTHSLKDAIAHAREADVAIHTIGLGQQARGTDSTAGFDEPKLQRMAIETGGIYHHSPTSKELRQLYESFAQDTKEEYVISVRSSRASYDGTRRDLKVTVGGSTGSGGYVEQHLLNVQSNLLVALILIVPLLMALITPLIWRTGRIKSNALPPPASIYPSESVSAQSVSYPNQPPYYTPPVQSAAPVWPQASLGLSARNPQVEICSRCRQPVNSSKRFCTHCVANIAADSTKSQSASRPGACSRCGQPLQTGMRFCRVCRQRVS